MRDRQVFETHILPNGIRLMHYPADFPFAIMHIILPFGHAHNTEEILPGSAHFLEHMGASHSKLYPRRHEFAEWVGLQGGYTNAQTGNFTTTYLAEIPVGSVDRCWDGLSSQVFEPLFKEEDIAMQRGIISAERKRKERWFPGSNELTHYLKTKWEYSVPTTLRQIFGNDEDLHAMDEDMLKKFHSYYFDSGITVLSGGTVDIKKIADSLMSLKVRSHKPPERYELPTWAGRDYSEVEFNDVSQPILYLGVISPHLPDYPTKVAIDFIGDFLTNSDHGPLYHWLRNEKGWIYGMSFKSYFEKYTHWTMTIPLHEKEQVRIVRQEIWDKIVQATSDQRLIDLEVKRKLGAQTFHFQTLESIIAGAEYDLELYGEVRSEEDYRAYLKRCADPAYIKKVLEEYFAPELWGEFCALPRQPEH